MKNVILFLQKYLGFIMLVSFALLFVYALGMATPTAIFKSHDSTRDFYGEIQPYNNAILIVSIVGLLLGALYMVLRNNVRPIYYVSNFVYFGISIAFSIFAGIYTILGVSFYLNKYNQVLDRADFCEIDDYLNTYVGKRINQNSPVFVFGFLVAALTFVVAVLLIAVLVMKTQDRLRYEDNKRNGISNPVTYDGSSSYIEDTPTDDINDYDNVNTDDNYDENANYDDSTNYDNVDYNDSNTDEVTTDSVDDVNTDENFDDYNENK